VSRPHLIEVEHATVDGEAVGSTYTGSMARVVAHTVDHLGGLLFLDRMPTDSCLVPAED
jgi:peptide deformylase